MRTRVCWRAPDYNYLREYDPQAGRYIELDPIELGGGSYSTYDYLGGNPLRASDPVGLAPKNKFPPSYYLKVCDGDDWKECETIPPVLILVPAAAARRSAALPK